MRVVASLLILVAAALPAAEPQLRLVGVYASGHPDGAEIVSVQSASGLALLSDSSQGTVDVLDLADPRAPTLRRRIGLGLAAGETLTTVSIHPHQPWFALAIGAADPLTPGRVELRDLAGALLATVPCGVDPDAVAIDPSGRFAVVADEAEAFVLVDGELRSAPGSITVLDLRDGPAAVRAQTLALPDPTGTAGGLRGEDRRLVERAIDLDGDDRISKRLDLDGDGRIVDRKLVVAHHQGQEVLANERDGGEAEVLVPLVDARPALLEPEYVAFGPDGVRAYVSLQEHNLIAIVDPATPAILAIVGCGITRHPADLVDDDEVAFDGTLRALREPDGLAVTPDGRFLLSADEGDTKPKVGKRPLAGGGRTLSVYTADGTFVADTGDALDRLAAAAGVYPDRRSDQKGSEPENVVAFSHAGARWAAVGLERADAVALVRIADDGQPSVVQVQPLGRGHAAPEGLAVLQRDGGTWILSANEQSGTLCVLSLQ